MSEAAYSDERDSDARRHTDVGPGERSHGEDIGAGVRSYLMGLGFAVVLTAGSFTVLHLHLAWAPAIPIAVIVFAIAQMGIHLVFFLHITSGPDNTNNTMALAFGVLIVMLLFGGSLWIMAHLNIHMKTMHPTAALSAPTRTMQPGDGRFGRG